MIVLNSAKKIGQFVRRVRLNERISQEELAYKVNVSQTSLSRCERGKSQLALSKMILNKMRALNDFKKYLI
jgi:transcriptional regulator with XRE-family HTH domain